MQLDQCCEIFDIFIFRWRFPRCVYIWVARELVISSPHEHIFPFMSFVRYSSLSGTFFFILLTIHCIHVYAGAFLSGCIQCNPVVGSMWIRVELLTRIKKRFSLLFFCSCHPTNSTILIHFKKSTITQPTWHCVVCTMHFTTAAAVKFPLTFAVTGNNFFGQTRGKCCEQNNDMQQMDGEYGRNIVQCWKLSGIMIWMKNKRKFALNHRLAFYWETKKNPFYITRFHAVCGRCNFSIHLSPRIQFNNTSQHKVELDTRRVPLGES